MAETNLMRANFSLDIANADRDDWQEAEWMQFARDRLVKMRAKRSETDAKWNEYETQVNAISFYDNEGNLQVNSPLEKTLGEIYMGRTNGRATFDIVPDGQADVEELQPTKYAMQFFMDGNGKENFWKENKLMRENKWRYGSGIFYTGIRSYRDWRYGVKEGAVLQDGTDILDEKNFDKSVNETWFFFPKSIHPKDFFIDDAAYGQPDVQYADDCIFKEKLTVTEFNERYADNKAFLNVDQVQYWNDINPKNKDDSSIDVRRVVLYHYFHRITKKYLIFANETNLVFNGLYLYDDGKLPFVNVQHYSNSNRFWGEGIPERVAWLKFYRSEILQDILTGAAMSSGIHLLAGNDDQIGQDWTVGGRGVNIWRTTNGAERVQQVNTSPNLGYFTAVLTMLDREVVTCSGMNPLSQIEANAPTLGQEEIIEGNKAVRNSSVDENYNIGLDDALTMMLSRIKQFAPALLAEKRFDSNGKVIKFIFPKIRIDGYTVERKNNRQVFVENIGKYGYFELKPEVVQGVGVKITTGSTNSIIPVMERQKIKEFVANMVELANLAQLDPTGATAKAITETAKVDELIGWMADAYGYDITSLKAVSAKDKRIKAARDKITAIKELVAPTEPAAQPAAPQPAAPEPVAAPSAEGELKAPTQTQYTRVPFSWAATGHVEFTQ